MKTWMKDDLTVLCIILILLGAVLVIWEMSL